jgi:peptidoglycan/xylan/chitin deacetylase (PgdA/CDA1 family)
MRKKWLILQMVWLVCCFGLPVEAHRAGERTVPILLYHSISEDDVNPLAVSPARFREQMLYLRDRGYQALQFADLAGWERGRLLPPKSVIITFDDGYQDNFTTAYPILQKLGLKATVFAVTGSIGKRGYLTWGQLRRMEASGVIDTQSHTVTHPDLTKLSSESKRRELSDSREAIRRHLGHTPQALAYPYALYDQPAINAAVQAGYRYAVTAEPGYAEVKQGLLKLHRNLITGETTMEQFRQLLP